MPLIVAVFEVEKDTKNTIKFQETPVPGSPEKIGTLYVQKWVFERPARKLRVTVEVLE